MQTQRLAVTLLEHLFLRVRSHLAQGELARVAFTGLWRSSLNPMFGLNGEIYIGISSGKLTWLLKIVSFSEFSHATR